MAVETTNVTNRDLNASQRSVMSAMWRGWRNKCPSCAKGTLRAGYLKINDECSECGEELHHQRADDAPPYFTIFLVGHIVIPLALWLEMAYKPPLWVQGLFWGPITVILALWLLPRFKGALVGLQWANYMHGFGETAEDPAAPQ